MNDEYIIVNKTLLEKRIEELENVIEEKKIGVENERWLKHELKQILSQSLDKEPDTKGMNEQKLKELTAEMEARAVEFKKVYLNHKGDGASLRHYWNGKLSETLFVIEKLKSLLNK